MRHKLTEGYLRANLVAEKDFGVGLNAGATPHGRNVSGHMLRPANHGEGQEG